MLPPVTTTFPDADVALPFLCDSPHSGTGYPDDFGYAVPLAELRSGEDTHIDALWRYAPVVGATLVAANFPRTYIDPNRPEHDVDPDMLDAPWPGAVAASEQCRRGYGLLWRQVRADAPIYARRLAPAEVRHRIEHYWRPYHAAVAREAERLYARSGALWHLNLHSMPHNAYERLGIASTTPLADFVLGDLDGTSSEPAFVDALEAALASRGYRVARNDPYKGLELLRRTGQPARRRHSVQVEVNRSLYMVEATREPNAGYARLHDDLTLVLARLAAYVRGRLKEMDR